MRIFALADLHLDSKKEKPMNIFGENWTNHEEKIVNNWIDTVDNDDLVLIAGDISWAIKLEEAVIDLRIIENLPGKKIMIRGNHDYWWSTKNKLDKLSLETIEFIKSEIAEYDDFVVCGTRGWSLSEDGYSTAEDEKIYKRELVRFELALSMLKDDDKLRIAMLHFPPFNNDGSPNDFVSLMTKYKIDICIYGHLHGAEGHKLVREGIIDGIQYHCVASDYLDFKLKQIL